MNTDWHDLAACKGEPAKVFFPDGAYASSYISIAKAVCSICPVVAECREAGAFETYGIWGGLTPEERGQRVRHPRRRPPCGTPAGYGAHRNRGEVPCASCRQAEARRQALYRNGRTG